MKSIKKLTALALSAAVIALSVISAGAAGSYFLSEGFYYGVTDNNDSGMFYGWYKVNFTFSSAFSLGYVITYRYTARDGRKHDYPRKISQL